MTARPQRLTGRHASRSAAVWTIAMLLLSGCSTELPQFPALGRSADVPPMYAFLYEPGLGHDELTRAWKGLPYESIALERQGCFGTCPSYTVTLRRGGEVDYEGRAFVERQGHWVGQVDVWEYARLCYLIDELKLSDFPPRYAAPWTDASTVTITAVPAETGSAIAVSEYGGFGPPRLWALQMAIDATAARIAWSTQAPNG
jgi:Domain of unknown function (DUF6438)